MVDLKGQTFGHLVVVKPSVLKTKSGGYRWDCLCDCGKTCTISSTNLVTNHTKSCGCRKGDMIARKKTKSIGNSAFSSLFSGYMGSARQRGLAWGLSQEIFMGLTKEPCHYCGREPENVSTKQGLTYVFNGIDRIDNNGGYTADNVLPCCATCNYAKRDMTYEGFTTWIARAHNHLTSIKPWRMPSLPPSVIEPGKQGICRGNYGHNKGLYTTDSVRLLALQK